MSEFSNMLLKNIRYQEILDKVTASKGFKWFSNAAFVMGSLWIYGMIKGFSGFMLKHMFRGAI